MHHEKSFLPAFFFKGYIDDLFDNLVSGKRNYCFGKRSGKNLYEPCMIHFPTIRYVTVTSPLFAYESLKPNYSQAFYFYQAFQICDYSKKYFTGFESQDVTYLPMIALVSTLDFQQTYNITVDLRLLSRMGWFFAQAHLFRLLRKNEEFLEVLHVYCCVSSIPVRTHLKFVLLGLQDWLQLQKRWHLQETRREGV